MRPEVPEAAADDFSWLRHLSSDEVRQFVRELADEVGCGRADARAVVVGWRASARILADPELTRLHTRSLPDEDHGPVTPPQ